MAPLKPEAPRPWPMYSLTKRVWYRNVYVLEPRGIMFTGKFYNLMDPSLAVIRVFTELSYLKRVQSISILYKWHED